MLQGPVVGSNTLRVDGGPQVFGWGLQGHFLTFHIQKGERGTDHWDAQGQVGSSNSPLRPQRLCLLVLLLKLGQGCYCWVEHKRSLEFNFCSNQLRWGKPHSWCLVLGNLGCQEVCLDLGVALILIVDALNIEPGFRQTAVFLATLCLFKAKSFSKYMLSFYEKVQEGEQGCRSSTYSHKIEPLGNIIASLQDLWEIRALIIVQVNWVFWFVFPRWR